MESEPILEMVLVYPNSCGFITFWVISDDDSVIRSVLVYPDPSTLKRKGKLPKFILQPTFTADPGHHVKVVVKYWYNLKNKPVAQSTMTIQILQGLKINLKNIIK